MSSGGGNFCLEDGCVSTDHAAQGFCHTHYPKARRNGTIEKLDASHLHLISDPNPETRLGTCQVCGPSTPLCRGNGGLVCAIKKRQQAAKRRARADVREYHRQYNAAQVLPRRLANYRLTLSEWDRMVEECDSACSICRTPLLTVAERYVDHDHACCSGRKTCGKCVRAILCQSCNFGLGAFRDSPELLRGATEYLGRFSREAAS